MIIAAGETLLERDIKVTGYALQKELGGGHPSRLAKTWATHQKTTAACPMANLTNLAHSTQASLGNLEQQIAQLQATANLLKPHI